MPSEFFKSIPVSLTGSGADFAQIDSSYEQWYGHEAGEGLVAGYDSVGSRYWGNLTSTADSSTDSVGSYTDTFYNEAIGTHPGTSLSVGSTTSKLHIMQDSTDAAPAGVFVAADSNGDVYEMDSASVIKFGIRLAEQLHGNEFNGSFRLASTAPNADYSIWDSVVFSDTLTNGSTDYHIWRRFNCDTPAAPATNSLRLTSSDSANLQEMTPTELQTVAVAALLAGQEASGIGSYQLRSSADGAPTDPGTWVARGVALDTRNTTQNLQYTSPQYTTAQFTRQYTGNYTGQYTGQSFADVPTQFAGFRQVQFAGFIAFAGNYAGDRNYAGAYAGVRNYTNQYVSAPEQFTSFQNYAGSRNYSGNYSRPGQFTGTRNFLGPAAYVGYFSGNYAGFRQAYWSGSRGATVYYSGNYAGGTSYVPFVGYFGGSRNYSGSYAGNSVGYFSSPLVFVGGVFPELYVSYGTTNSTGYFTGFFGGSRNYSASYVGQTFNGAFTPYYAGSRSATVYYSGNYLGPILQYFGGSRARFFSGTANFTGNPQTFAGTRNFSGSRNYAANYGSPIQYTGVRQYTGFSAFAGNFAGDRNYAGAYGGSRNYSRQYVGPQAGQFTGIVPTEYTAQYANTYTEQYTSAYTSQYSAQYTGETIVALTATIESYTLYCKISES